MVHLYSTKELQDIRKAIYKEFETAHKGSDTSLAYARHTIDLPQLPDGTKGQVLVLGGSNCVSALVEKQEGTAQIISVTEEPLPTFTSREVLLDYVLSHLHGETVSLGLNFAYPMEPMIRQGRLDGTLLRGTKEHTFTGMTGNVVGETIEAYIKEKLNREVQLTVANDTVCLVLSGIGSFSAEGLAGGVIGTGFNFGFFVDERTLINLESGNFDKFTPTESCLAFDASMENRGAQLWEKEIAGAYLYRHYNYYVEHHNLKHPPIHNSQELSEIAAGASGDNDLAQNILKRSARFVATQIAAMFDFLGKPRITVLIEGSLYWKGWGFQSEVAHALGELGIEEGAITITSIDKSHIRGGAALILGK